MKTLRFAVAAAVAFGSVSAFATNARVESMGKSTTFIMDDMSIFDNPANINLYPNFLIGELGHYSSESRTPVEPWFGGIFSLDMGSGLSLSIAGVLNRSNERLLKYFPDRVIDATNRYQNTNIPDPVTNFDGFLGANVDNIALGLHVYIAHQDGLDNDGQLDAAAFASAFQLDAGTNIEISTNYAIELAGGIARIQYGPSNQDLFDSKLLSVFGRARLFSRLDAINGHLIPAASLYNMNALGRDELDVNLGMGLDAAFERGFFWMGLNGFYNSQSAGYSWKRDPETGETSYEEDGGSGWGNGDKARLWQVGGKISFGIERNIWWDWFVVRVGGQKVIAYADYKKADDNPNSVLCASKIGCSEDGNYFATNSVSDGTKDDHVGFGVGVNIEEKLKIDATLTEDFLFRSPIITRVSATYSF